MIELLEYLFKHWLNFIIKSLRQEGSNCHLISLISESRDDISVLKNHFDGIPKLEDFELVEEELPPLEIDQFLFHSLFIRFHYSFLKPTIT